MKIKDPIKIFRVYQKSCWSICGLSHVFNVTYMINHFFLIKIPVGWKMKYMDLHVKSEFKSRGKRAETYHFKITYIYLSIVNSSFICSENTSKAIRVPFSAMLNRLIIYQIYDQHLLIQYNDTIRLKISEYLSKIWNHPGNHSD